MSLRETLYITLSAAAMMLAVSCIEMPSRIDDGRIVASVGDRMLQVREVKASLPSGVRGEDSLEFVSLYINRWITRQVKIREAERIFSSSVGDIEMMVSEYRQSLLTHKLDQFYINEMKERPFSESDILIFYNRNSDIFRLDRPIVKGTIIKIPNSYDNIKGLREMMQKRDKESRLNLLSICDRVQGIEFSELDVEWIDYDDFIARLPIVRGKESGVYMKRDGVQSLSDGSYTYLFEIAGYRSAGYVAPLETVREEVERILTTQHQQELIREQDQKLYRVAKRMGDVTLYVDLEE